MSNYDELVEFRNKIVNDADYDIYEEDCQLFDRVLDDYEQKDQRIAELENYKNSFENFIDELATQDCEYEGMMSGWDRGGYGPYPKYRQKYEELQRRILAQVEKDLEAQKDILGDKK